jgi:predicted Holliday junction resolvase-like endonuclease
VPVDTLGLVAGIAIGLMAGWIYLLVWKARYSALIRQDAIDRSRAVTSGKVHEQLISYLPGFPYNPRDIRFLGSPVDLVVFDGLADGELRKIVFVEVKTGRSGLTYGERMVRAAVEEGEVEWAELRVPSIRSPEESPI